VDVVVGELSRGRPVRKFCDYLLLSVEEESANPVETVVLEIAAI
jgi:hypothetical protein